MSEQLDAEMSVLGSMYIAPSCITDVQGILNDKDFADIRHQIIFKAIVDVYEKSNTVDIILLRNHLEQTKQLEIAGGVGYLVEVGEAVPSAASVEHYSELVCTASQLRRVASELTQGSRSALDPRTKPGELVTALCGKLEGIVQTGSSGDIGFSCIERAWQLCEGEFPPAIPSGFRAMDSFTGGFGPKELTTIGARPSMGKTALIVNVLINLIAAGYKVGFFSIEMTKTELMDRVLGLLSEVNIKALKECHREGWVHMITEDQKKAIQDAAVWIENRKHLLWVDDSCGLTVEQIESRMCQKDRQCDVLFVDHLGELTLIGKENLAFKRGDAVRRIRNVGKKHDHHTILVAQLNRLSVGRTEKRPHMADLEGSGGIEQASNNVMLLHRDDYYHKGEIGHVNNNLADIIVDKARAGETGVKQLQWLPEFTKFKEM